MTENEQRIAIAEACGWKRTRIGTQSKSDPEPRGWLAPNRREFRIIPDYLNDLNAMHEAEKTLKNKGEALIYSNHLRKLQEALPEQEGADINRWRWHASAARRAEAFLRTIGK